MSNLLSSRCTRCGLSVGRAMLAAIAIDMGGGTNIDPLKCPETDYKEEHDYDVKLKESNS